MGLWGWGAVPGWAQEAAPPGVESIWEAYRQFDYTEARERAQAALAVRDRYTLEDLAEVHIILGLIAYSENEQGEARQEFIDALILNPNARLDALQVSPKILDFFEETRMRLEQTRPEDLPDAVANPRYVLVPDRRAEAALRSMVLPGWGQLYKGQRTKGRVLLGVWGGAVVSSVTAHILRQEAYNDYKAASNPADAAALYDPFNRWHKARNALVLGAAVVWAYGYLDALVSGNRIQEQRNLQITPSFYEHRLRVSVQVHF